MANDGQDGMSDIDLAYVQAVMGQRDRALHELAQAQAQVMVASRQLTLVTAERDELRKAFDALIKRQTELADRQRQQEAAPTDTSTGAAALAGVDQQAAVSPPAP